ncbi:helix-turn-helix transcriptional regulator [Conexibacter stalactiti]|uniref:Helix-turn-helix transcriptional regulator n=1 Tax=Conexibacter stalactiti TaxID=1940611 RepID=A0ABU4HJG5_9ACTN|nr:helix-turn-helix transcriptional regulator [Conexibacter stalactiti]MDW5593454.1 helix-turn-helix transcriptional regulator [Conexibacter stalactiti]MEC5034095.1 helix-turn-helix transcriptional regulator [Conexibacter stalactiti]
MQRADLADFLRRRREALRPEDIGLLAGARRRTRGLRREEVALLADMSTDYYTRMEQGRGSQPSQQMLASIARALRLNQDERDHLFRLAGHTAPARTRASDHVSPALMRVLDRLDAPAQVMSYLGDTLVQNALAIALLGRQTHHTGPARSGGYRWFTDPRERTIYPPEDQDRHARVLVSGLRAMMSRYPGDARAEELVELLTRESPEFVELWAEHEIHIRREARKRLVHPTVGVLELDCQILIAEENGQSLLVYTATPGTESYDKLQLLAVLGSQRFDDRTAEAAAESARTTTS